MKTIIGTVVLGATIAGVYALNGLTRTEEGKSLLNVAPALEIEVETETPEQRGIIRTVQAPGEVEAIEEVDISSEVVAKIIELPVEEGDFVKKGDLLCRLDDADYRARVLSAEANVDKLKASIKQAQADLDRIQLDYDQERRLFELGNTSNQAFARIRALLIGAQAVVEMRKQELIQADAALQSAKEDLARTVIQSPINGTISQRFAEPGEIVITGTMNNLGTRIMVVSDLSMMQVRCRIDEADAPLVAAGQVAHIYLQSDTRRSIRGEVLRVATKGTKAQGRDVVTFETLVVIVGDDPRVKPGMSANVEIEVARKSEVLTIPVQAIVHRKRREVPEALLRQFDEQLKNDEPEHRRQRAEYFKLVFCVQEEKAHARLVKTGISDATGVEIVEGIVAGDEIVIGPYRSLDQLKDGTTVKIKEKTDAATTRKGSAQTAEGAKLKVSGP